MAEKEKEVKPDPDAEAFAKLLAPPKAPKEKAASK